MPKTKTSFFVIGLLIAMLVSSLLTVLILYLLGAVTPSTVELEFTVKPVAPKEYDGTPLTPFGYVWNEGNLKKGHRMEITPVGEQTECGTSDGDLRINIYDEKGYSANNQYAIKVNKCPLTVTSRKLTILLNSPQDIPYSGNEAEIKEMTIFKGTNLSGEIGDFQTGELMYGHKLIVSFPGFENVGDVLPDARQWDQDCFKIYDRYGNSVTSNYELDFGTIGGGDIKIVPRKIKVNALDVEKTFDGTGVQGKFELASGALAEGHFIGDVEYTDADGINASVVNVNDSKAVKVSKVTIYEQVGNDVRPLSETGRDANYELDLQNPVYGVWSVTPRKINVVLEEQPSVIYSGDTITLNSGAYAITSLISSVNVALSPSVNDKLTQLRQITGYFEAECDKEICDVGIYHYTVNLTESGENIFGKGNLICESGRGKIEVTQLPVKLAYIGDTDKYYDGKEIEFYFDKLRVKNSADENLDNFVVSSAVFSYGNVLDRAAVGPHPITLKDVRITKKENSLEDITRNFSITVPAITATINKARLQLLYTGPESRVYDGNDNDFKNLDFLTSSFTVIDEETKRILTDFVVLDATFKYCIWTGTGGLVVPPDTLGASEGPDLGTRLNFSSIAPKSYYGYKHDYYVHMEGIVIGKKDYYGSSYNSYKDIQSDVERVVLIGNTSEGVPDGHFKFSVEYAELRVPCMGTQVGHSSFTSGYTASQYANKLQNSLWNTLTWEGLQEGDVISYDTDVDGNNLAIKYPLTASERFDFTIDWSKVHITRRIKDDESGNFSDPLDVKDCYNFTSGDTIIFTLIWVMDMN